MTRNAFGRSTSRQLTVATTALLGVAVAVALVGGTRTREASAGAMPTDPGAGSVVAAADVDCLTDDLTGALIGQPRAAGAKVRDVALVQWDVCVAGRAGCGVGVTVQYIVDPESTGSAADSAEVPEAEREGITMKALRVGPFRQDRAAALA